MSWNVLGKGFDAAAQAMRGTGKASGNLGKDVEKLGNKSTIAGKGVKKASDSMDGLHKSSHSLQKGVRGFADLVQKYGLSTTDAAKASIKGTAMMSENVSDLRKNVSTLAKNSLEYRKTTGKSAEESMRVMTQLGHEFELVKERQLEYHSSTRTLAEELPKAASAIPKIASHAAAAALTVVDTVADDLHHITGNVLSGTGAMLTEKAKQISGGISTAVKAGAPLLESAVSGTFEAASNYLSKSVNENLVTAEEAAKFAEDAQNRFITTMGVVEDISGMSEGTMVEMQRAMLSTRMNLPLEEIEKITRMVGSAAEQLGMNGDLAARALTENYDSFLSMEEGERADYAKKLIKAASVQQQAGYDFGKYAGILLGSTGTDRLVSAAKFASLSGQDSEEVLAAMGRAETGDTDAVNFLQETAKQAFENLGGADIIAGENAMKAGTATAEQDAAHMRNKAIKETMLSELGLGISLTDLMALTAGKKSGSEIFGVTAQHADKAENLTTSSQEDLLATQKAVTTTDQRISRAEGEVESAIFSTLEPYAEALSAYVVVAQTYNTVMADVSGSLGDAAGSLAKTALIMAGIAVIIDGLTGGSLANLLPAGALGKEAGREATGGDAYAKAVRGEISREDALASLQADIAAREADLKSEKGKWGVFKDEDVVSLMESDIATARKSLHTLQNPEAFEARQAAENDRKGGLTGFKNPAPSSAGRRIEDSRTANNTQFEPESQDSKNAKKLVGLTERMLFCLEQERGTGRRAGANLQV